MIIYQLIYSTYFYFLSSPFFFQTVESQSFPNFSYLFEKPEKRVEQQLFVFVKKATAQKIINTRQTKKKTNLLILIKIKG
jgi:hypothetical protein